MTSLYNHKKESFRSVFILDKKKCPKQESVLIFDVFFNVWKIFSWMKASSRLNHVKFFVFFSFFTSLSPRFTIKSRKKTFNLPNKMEKKLKTKIISFLFYLCVKYLNPFLCFPRLPSTFISFFHLIYSWALISFLPSFIKKVNLWFRKLIILFEFGRQNLLDQINNDQIKWKFIRANFLIKQKHHPIFDIA